MHTDSLKPDVCVCDGRAEKAKNRDLTKTGQFNIRGENAKLSFSSGHLDFSSFTCPVLVSRTSTVA